MKLGLIFTFSKRGDIADRNRQKITELRDPIAKKQNLKT